MICSISYFTFCTTEYLKIYSEIGRYQFLNDEYQLFVNDTKNGSFYRDEQLEFKKVGNK